MALAQALVAWAPLAAAGLKALAATPGSRPSWLVQFHAACISLGAAVRLATRHDMQPPAALRIAAACQLVFDVGRRVTAALAAQTEAVVAAGQRPRADALYTLLALSLMQVEAVAESAYLLHPKQPGSAAAAFARSTAKPAALLPWLAAVLHGLKVVAQHEAELAGFEPKAGAWEAGRGLHFAAGSH